jgi:hypothetical protein
MSKRDTLGDGRYFCDNCGNKIYSDNAPTNGGIMIKQRFCSAKCKNDWNALHSDQHQTTKSPASGGIIGSILSDDRTEEQESPEEARARRELEEEKEREEKKSRKEKAERLRSEGKNFLAFIVEFQNGVITGAIILVIAIFALWVVIGTKSVEKKDFELTKIEDQVKTAIDNGDKENALKLLEMLYLNSTQNSTHKVEGSVFGLNTYTYKDYWDHQREIYRGKINKMPKKR